MFKKFLMLVHYQNV